MNISSPVAKVNRPSERMTATGGSSALTKRQLSIYEFLAEEIRRKGIAPSYAEIGARFGIKNPNGVRSHLIALERKGLILRAADKARAIQILAPPPGYVSRLISSAKRLLWEKRRCGFHLPVHIALATRKGYTFFVDKFADDAERRIRKVAAAHDWELIELHVRPSEILVRLAITPDHSVERVVRNIKTGLLPMRLRHPIYFHGKSIWARGFAASTDPWIFKELAARHRESSRTHEELDEAEDTAV